MEASTFKHENLKMLCSSYAIKILFCTKILGMVDCDGKNFLSNEFRYYNLLLTSSEDVKANLKFSRSDFKSNHNFNR